MIPWQCHCELMLNAIRVLMWPKQSKNGTLELGLSLWLQYVAPRFEYNLESFRISLTEAMSIKSLRGRFRLFGVDALPSRPYDIVTMTSSWAPFQIRLCCPVILRVNSVTLWSEPRRIAGSGIRKALPVPKVKPPRL